MSGIYFRRAALVAGAIVLAACSKTRDDLHESIRFTTQWHQDGFLVTQNIRINGVAANRITECGLYYQAQSDGSVWPVYPSLTDLREANHVIASPTMKGYRVEFFPWDKDLDPDPSPALYSKELIFSVTSVTYAVVDGKIYTGGTLQNQFMVPQYLDLSAVERTTENRYLLHGQIDPAIKEPVLERGFFYRYGDALHEEYIQVPCGEGSGAFSVEAELEKGWIFVMTYARTRHGLLRSKTLTLLVH